MSPKIIQIFEACVEEFGLDALSVAEHTVSADKKCVYKCMIVKFGAMDESGAIDYAKIEENMKEYGPPGSVEAIKVCSQQKIQAADDCKFAENLSLCIEKQMFG